MSVRARGGSKYLDFMWLPDSGIYRTLMAEKHWKRLTAINPGMKLTLNLTGVVDSTTPFPENYNNSVSLKNKRVKRIAKFKFHHGERDEP